MKMALPLTLLLALAVATPLHAKGKKKGGGGKGPAAEAPAAQAGNGPGGALAPYIEKLDALLALHPPAGPFFAEADGHLAVLRQRFVTEGQAAAEGEKQKFAAAVVTCDAITAAVNERKQTAGNLQASHALQGSSKLNQGPRKDVLNQGVRGGDFAKGVGEIQEGKREKAANRAAKATAASDDQALTAMAVNRWNQRSAQLKQSILADYAKIQ
jgi:hypothetical protein